MACTFKTDVDCKECGRKLDSHQGFVEHIIRKHGYSRKSYALKFYYNNVIPKCACGCGKETDFAAGGGWDFRNYVNGHNWVNKKRTEENKENCRKANLGAKNPMFDKHWTVSKETKCKMSIARLAYAIQHPEWNTGKSNPNWRGGISGKPYSNFGRAIKNKVKERDGNRCRLCLVDKRLSVHHIDYNKKKF